MELASSLRADWGALVLTAIIVGGLLWALYFFLRQNRNDYREMLNDLKSRADEDDGNENSPVDASDPRRG